jgi:hypothetical protein
MDGINPEFRQEHNQQLFNLIFIFCIKMNAGKQACFSLSFQYYFRINGMAPALPSVAGSIPARYKSFCA